MFINEIAAGSKVTLVVKDTKNKIILESEVLYDIVNEKCKLAVQAFKYNDTIIRFDYGSIKAYIDNNDNKSYVFPISCIYSEKDKEIGTYHVLCCDQDVSFVNKRGAVRVPLNSNVKVITKSGCILAKPKDISHTGLSFYLDKDTDVSIGDNMTCEFEQLFIKCKVNCTITRLVQSTNNKILVGCKLNTTYKNVCELVNSIQLQHRRNFKRI